MAEVIIKLLYGRETEEVLRREVHNSHEAWEVVKLDLVATASTGFAADVGYLWGRCAQEFLERVRENLGNSEPIKLGFNFSVPDGLLSNTRVEYSYRP